MDDMKDCKMSGDCKMQWCGIFGIVFIVLATILTLFTLSGFGILGMFIVGLMFCCHKHMSKKSCCCCCKCCDTSDMGECEMPKKVKAAPEKKKAEKKTNA